ncbi:M81 family metallopeptidase [Sphingobium sp. SCG-1]|uniref:M81 family metallopeptidase n=1 Tax=Sphingobium sp. SCG-1 TaxID=2072936 RepID=UPI00166FA75F|nr:M81 family metallopeptidase [Sphingobium sp. SCG-1]
MTQTKTRQVGRGPIRIFVACLAHETNSFSPIPTSLTSFEADCAYVPPAKIGRDAAMSFQGYGDAIAAISSAGDEVVEGPCFWTQPSGPVSRSVFEDMRNHILRGLERAGQIDAVFLVLHGAMMAPGVDDCEADILRHIRALLGDDVPIGAVLDLHGNVGAEMVATGTLLVGVKEYPHVDYRARVEELHAMLRDSVVRNASFVVSLRSIPVLSLQGTTEGPMKDLVRRLVDIEQQPGIRSVTLMHGFPWCDSEQTGAAALIITEGLPEGPANMLLDEIAERYTSIVTDAPVNRLTVEDALAEAMEIPQGRGPVIIADSSDNSGGGAASDSTFLLRTLLQTDCGPAALGMIWDPQAVRIAADAGVGARLTIRIGGKVGPLSGDPLDVDGEVISVRADVRQRFFSKIPNTPIGLAAVIRVDKVFIVLNSIRQQVFAPECFTEMGVNLSAMGIVVVKSTQHFRACFDPIARATLYCNAPGSLDMDLMQMPYRKLRLSRLGSAYAIDRPVVRLRHEQSSTE